MSSLQSPAPDASADSKWAVLRQRNFACFLAAKLLAALAIQMQSVAIGWQVYAATGSVLDLGWIGLAQFAPFFALILVAGHAADVVDRRRIIVAGYVVDALCAVLLLAYTFSGLTVVWPVFAVLVLFGAARAFMMPASQAILINLVPQADFRHAVALSSSSFHLAVILGPMLGGLLYLVSPAAVYVVVGIALLVAAALMLMTRSSQKLGAGGSASLQSVFEGLRFVWSKPVVLGAISLDLFAVLFGGATAMLPAVARDVLHADASALGLLRSATAVGAALTAVALAFYPLTRKVGRWMFGGVAVFGAGTIVFGLSHTLWISVAALAAMGAGDMVSVYIRHILVQLETPDAIRGRVSAVNAVFIGASNELGEFESGVTARWFGLVPSLVVGGLATLGVTAAWMGLFPVLRRMDRFPHEQSSAPMVPEESLGVEPGGDEVSAARVAVKPAA